ncbi:hypothetical protein Tco_1155326 [Tanacetum coccineum]
MNGRNRRIPGMIREGSSRRFMKPIRKDFGPLSSALFILDTCFKLWSAGLSGALSIGSLVPLSGLTFHLEPW